MKKGTLLNKLGKFLVLGIFCFLTSFFTQVCKAEDTLVTIKTQSIDSIDSQSLYYSLWVIPKNDNTNNIGELKEKLDNESTENLKEKYGQPINVKVNSSNISQIKLEDGLYYARAYVQGKTITDIVPFVFELPSKNENQITISPKVRLHRGNLKIFKYEIVAENKVPLKGVRFSVYNSKGWQFIKFKNGIYTTDMDGETVLETNEKGEINISDLLPGNYYLREVASLEGFKVLTEDVPVSIVADKTVVKEVENIRIPTDPPSKEKKSFLAKTGIQTGILLSVVGLIFSVFAIILVKKKYNQE
ncbi:prealbumin-like fold domain-containing protein [Gemella cuniculi]|uniref:prealbumin-like fold domain-containing protein n=1 Tax=Gemella cuniculi TaxID=150240 RepID=UPI00042164AB|nr:prealbumin-like fold domain-containing protein [Gemella cuniculi]